jgi:hypothetical protein
MIQFRCWYCNKHFSRPEASVGQRFNCACNHLVRVPRVNFGNSRGKTLTDWVIEAVVYGGGGGLLGFGLGVVLCAGLVRVFRSSAFVVVPALTLTGFLIGLFGGERGINLLGRMIRGSGG